MTFGSTWNQRKEPSMAEEIEKVIEESPDYLQDVLRVIIWGNDFPKFVLSDI